VSIEQYEILRETPDALISLLVSRDEHVSQLENEVDKLHHLLIQAKNHRFGKKSEKLSTSEQQDLFAFSPDSEEGQELEETPEPVIEVKCHARKKRTKRELPESLPRERIEYDLESSECPCCQKEMAVIGEELSEELEYVPASFKVIEHVRLKRACGSCKNGVYIPSLPPEVKPLERRQAGAGLLAQILVSKYQDHQPLYRQEQIFKRQGINLSRRLMCGWVEGAAELMLPLYEGIRKELLEETYLQADETTLKVQDPEVEGSLHTGYLWSLLGPPNRVFFHYAESRAGEVPKELLEEFKGRLQTDAYAGYNPVFLPSSCERIACMAHIRRKFIEAQSTSKSAASKVIALIAELYKLERQLRDKPPDERFKRRKKKAFPLLKKLYRLIREQRRTTLPQAIYAKALNYAWEQRVAMLRYLRDGRYEIDNNLIENQMRPVALGRKNYLFAGSHEGAKRAAVLYTLLNTCKLNGVNSYDYLRDVLTRINLPGVTLRELLPQYWKPSGNMG
jgi:transposase